MFSEQDTLAFKILELRPRVLDIGASDGCSLCLITNLLTFRLETFVRVFVATAATLGKEVRKGGRIHQDAGRQKPSS